MGSPPRARGKEALLANCCPNFWDHPRARGGRGSRSSKCRSKAYNHPRVRGEKALSVTLVRPTPGSPPRARGKASTVCSTSRHGNRITPACAGKSSPKHLSPSRMKDHPRVCGEKWTRPACAVYAGDHPRVCGEKQRSDRAVSQTALGSPPRVRGKDIAALIAACSRAGSPPRVRGKARSSSHT